MTALPLKNRLRPLTLSVWAAGHFWFCLTTMITSRSSDQWIFTGVFTLFHTCRVQMTAITTSGFDFIFQHTTSISTFCTILGNILHSYSYFRFSHSTSGRKPNMEMSVRIFHSQTFHTLRPLKPSATVSKFNNNFQRVYRDVRFGLSRFSP